MIRLILTALTLWASLAPGAYAMPFLAPVFGAVAAFAATPLGGMVVSLALNLGVGLLKQWLNGDKKSEQKEAGFKLTMTSGDVNPLSFIMGYGATAGSQKYIGSWGSVGDTKNANLVEVIQIGDLVTSGLPGVWAGPQKVTVDWAATPVAAGYPILEFRKNGVDYAWVRAYNGLQTTADSYLVDKFGAHPDRPWTSGFIGRGVPYVIVTTQFNRELFPNGRLSWLFEPGPVFCYDLRKDSTNGGSGAHRWTDQTTWEATVNPVVIIYNIIRGIYTRTGEWVYGGRNLPAFRLPPSSWIAAANECDVAIPLAAGGTEPQFRCGLEIDVSTEPLSAIETLLRSFNGRLSEIGGIFEVMAGAPGAAVYSFTDADIIISRNQSFAPAPGLEATYNGIEGTSPIPAERWVVKDAPSRYNATWEAEDGGRRVATGLQFAAVPFPVQVERLMLSLINDERRFRVHSFCLPPNSWVLTGSCIVSWTSARNGYVNKKFIVVRIDGEPGMLQVVTLREIDPADYSWSSSYQQHYATGSMTIERPAPQAMYGFAVFADVRKDNLNRNRSPTIRVEYASAMTDVRAVEIQVKLAGAADTAIYAEGEVPYGAPFYVLLPWTFSPLTNYEVRAKFKPYGLRETLFSSWLSVTTLDVKLTVGLDFDPYVGVIGFDNLGSDIAGYLSFIGENVREIRRQAEEFAIAAADETLANYSEHTQIARNIYLTQQGITARYSEAITLATGPGSSIVQRLETIEVTLNDPVTGLGATAGALDLVEARIDSPSTGLMASANAISALNASVGNYSASGQFRTYVAATEAGALATIGISTSTSGGGGTSVAALFLSSIAGGISRVTIVADQFVVTSPAGPQNPLVYDGVALRLNVANIGTITAGLLKSADNKMQIDLNNKRISIST